MRPMRLPAVKPAALIVGVYPSAFHVAWTPPEPLDHREDRRHPYIGSLAVDVEPVVFWDGTDPAPSTVFDRWLGEVRFNTVEHGTVRPGMNGPSGVGVVEQFLTPLGINPTAVALTDVMPWFFIKHGARSQGDAITRRFAPLAELLGVHPGSLPRRPTPRALVELAGSAVRRDSLRQELVEAGAPLVITLGQEAIDAVRAVADVAGVQERLVPSRYGRVGDVAIDGHRMSLLPLVHPAFVRQTKDKVWLDALARWRTEVARNR